MNNVGNFAGLDDDEKNGLSPFEESGQENYTTGMDV